MPVRPPLTSLDLDLDMLLHRLGQPVPPAPAGARPVPVAVAGATGLVGQKVLALLSRRPEFFLAEIAASPQRAGQRFGHVCQWKEPGMPLGPKLAGMVLVAPDQISAPYILSCLPTEAALEWEPFWLDQGKHVFSNASAFRMQPDVPLMVAEVNPDHLCLLAGQGRGRGHLVTGPNCVVAGLAPALAPLVPLAPIVHISIVTRQAVSGAGYPGLASLDILGNTIPHIPGEACKIPGELNKILGAPGQPLTIPMTVSVHRVPVAHGHGATVHILWDRSVDLAQVERAYQGWQERWPDLFVFYPEPDRPQVTLDLTWDDCQIHVQTPRWGATSQVLSLEILSHNLVRGAAGGLLANLQTYLDHLS